MNLNDPDIQKVRALVDSLNSCGRYISVRVLRPADFPDCTLNGITSRESRLYVPHPEGNFTEAQCEPDRILEVLKPAYPTCPPRFKPRNVNGWSMAGGNYVEGDSRFSSVYGGPVSVHDRVES